MEMEQKSLISELNQGKELAIQLITHIRPFSSSAEEEEKMCVFLSEKIHSSFEKALSILKWDESSDLLGVRKNKESGINKKHKNHHVLKKRKLLPRWREEVKACSGTGLEGPLNDGYCWRKYGQKDIHGATFPRCYYRCTHRNVQGCLATKQVQRSDNDSNVFDVTYRGRHTCSQSSISISTPKQIDQNPRDLIPFDFGQISNIKSEDFDDLFQSFCFPSPSIGSEIADENVFCGGGDGGSESNYFQTWDLSCGGGGEKEGIFRVQSSESDLTEMISASTSVTNSPIGGWDFSLDNVDFDPNFPFDNLEFFS